MKPISSNQITNICNVFNLGTPVGMPKPVFGGLLHKMWRLDTTTGAYAIKQLSTDIDLTPAVRNRYEQSEQIAKQFKEIGISAISALTHHQKHLFDCEGSSFLVYPWVDADTLTASMSSQEHALKIVQIVAKMHVANLQINNLPDLTYQTYTNQEIIELFTEANLLDLPFAKDLQENQNQLLEINNLCREILPVLQTKSVVSHADLDQKNVLWDQHNNPILIDWESAGKVNPVQEILSITLDWSGITTNSFDLTIFKNMLTCYQTTCGKLDPKMMQAALYGVQLNWINWLLFNVKRSINIAKTASPQLTLSTNQVSQTIKIILRIKKLTLTLLDPRNLDYN